MTWKQDLKILDTWRKNQNWTETGRIFGIPRYEAKKRGTRAARITNRRNL